MSVATVDLGEAPALPADRRRAGFVAAVLIFGVLLIVPHVGRPLGTSYPVFAIVMALSISSIAVTSLLLWAQSRVTQSIPLTVLALGYQLTAIVMIPYLMFYRGLWPQLGQLFSIDAQTSGWLWVEWHALFISSAIAYYLARGAQNRGAVSEPAAFQKLQQRCMWFGLGFLAVTVPAFVWIDGLPTLVTDGKSSNLFVTISYAMSTAAAAAIFLAYRTSRFRSVLDLWLAVACLSMFSDVTLQHFSRQFTAGWYASRISIVIAASAVLSVLLFQTATIYAQLAATAERLRNETVTDVLTGLTNRRGFDQRFDELLRYCARETRPLTLLMIDVDNFKVYNDAFGHQAGDECLRAVASILENSAARARDVVARIGGEEMAVIMPEVDISGALVVAERMRAAVQAAGIAQGAAAKHKVVTISVGVTAAADPVTTSPGEMLAAADRALYGAKDGGRNRVIEAREVLAGLPNA